MPVKVAAVERLRHRSEFRAAAAGGRASGNAFVLQVRQRADDKPPRVGFTVSKRVGNAVERNRVRRRLREIVRLSIAAGGRIDPAAAAAKNRKPLQAGHDYVLIGRRAALSLPFETMMQELYAALTRIHATDRKPASSAVRPRLHEAGPNSVRQKQPKRHLQ